MISSYSNGSAARQSCAALFACVLGAAGCAETTAPDPAPDVRAWVVGEAARSLDSDGRFVFPRAVIPLDSVIDEAQARALALAYVRTFAHVSSFARPLELQHEGSIDFERLYAAQRVEYAESVYEPLPDTVSASTRRAFGPAFLVRLLVGLVPTVNVAVSVYQTDIQIRDGKVVMTPGSAGGTFEALGSERTYGYSQPIGPEQATLAVGKATGAKIALVPSLWLPTWDYAPAFAKWRLTLDRTVSFRGVQSGHVYSTRIVYVGLRSISGVPGGNPDAMFVPLDTQPQMDSIGGNPPVILHVRGGSPVLFEEVAVSVVSRARS